MNCFSHGIRYLDDPYFLTGTALPDWLTLIDRKVRVRQRAAAEFEQDSDPRMRRLALGIIQHHRDDAWFHDNPKFVEMNLELSIQLRELLDVDAGFRPHFVAHVIIEMLLDASLTQQWPKKLDQYYEQVAGIDAEFVQQAVNRIARESTQRLVQFIPRFINEAYVYDYLSDQGVMYRMNRILNHVKLSQLPDSFLDWLPSVRRQVYEATPSLLNEFYTEIE